MIFFKKLLMGSIALTLFAIAILIFQLSCTKTSWGHDNTGNENCNGGQGKIVLYVDHNDQDPSPAARNFWLMDSNGANRRKVTIVFPSADITIETGKFIDKGTKILFSATKANDNEQINIVYKCNLDGSGLTELFRGASYINIYELNDTY